VDEHADRVIEMIKRFGIPQGVDRFESAVKLIEYIHENGLDGKIAMLPDSREIVGFILFCMGYVWPLDDRRFHKSEEIGYISDIIVNPDFQRRGIGSILVKSAERDLVQRGARKMMLITSTTNKNAQAFFKKNGYSISGQTDVVGFEKKLDSPTS